MGDAHARDDADADERARGPTRRGAVRARRRRAEPYGEASVRAGLDGSRWLAATDLRERHRVRPRRGEPRDDDLPSDEDGALRPGQDEREDVDRAFHELVDQALVGVVALLREGVGEAASR